ncbi:hypothetical protein [Roseimicrobium sp. ORNL1]|uniref:hypothetical protein n=1 Tax=Roseimicrobium sp. ORNL1 TaxID=2711231 RepID=UPI0013E19271|nr:hypothetical protein [Roseimicrobium sp. ORNL1]QIF01639.1 hypothetical protein G5S37_08920 [Roseimicrobium sp. ORNL1]
MKIRCKCGAVIPDNSDFLSYKAHVVADQDWEDFEDMIESGKRVDSWFSFVRTCYQCPHCGRLYVEDASRELHAFAPEGHQTKVLSSSKGPDWRGHMGGNWEDQPVTGHPKGDLWSNGVEGTFKQFDDWSQLEPAYYALFDQLCSAGRLRSAFLRKNGEIVHSWKPDA